MSERIKILDELIEMLERLIDNQGETHGWQESVAKDLKRERLNTLKEVRDLLIDEQPTLNENQMWMVWTNEFGIVTIGNKAECEKSYEQEKENYFSYDLTDVDESEIGHQVILAKLGKSCGLFECPDGLFEVKELDGTDLEEVE